MQLKQTPFVPATLTQISPHLCRSSRHAYPVFAPKPGYASGMAQRGVQGGAIVRVPKVYFACAVALTLGLLTPVLAQSNLDAGKSPAQIFSDTCNACHRSPREIRRTSPAFLRDHYTTGMREAAAMAAYLAAVGSDARAVQQRKPPVLGAGRVAAGESGRPTVASAGPADPDAQMGNAALSGRPAAEAATPDQSGSAGPPKIRRPSGAIEIGVASPSAAPVRRAAQSPLPPFEE
jgi:hypothetical protein